MTLYIRYDDGRPTRTIEDVRSTSIYVKPENGYKAEMIVYYIGDSDNRPAEYIPVAGVASVTTVD